LLRYKKFVYWRKIFIFVPVMSKKEQYQQVYEDDEAVTIWTYDLTKFKNGPISVEIKYKHPPEKKQTNREKFSKKK